MIVFFFIVVLWGQNVEVQCRVIWCRLLCGLMCWLQLNDMCVFWLSYDFIEILNSFLDWVGCRLVSGVYVFMLMKLVCRLSLWLVRCCCYLVQLCSDQLFYYVCVCMLVSVWLWLVMLFCVCNLKLVLLFLLKWLLFICVYLVLRYGVSDRVVLLNWQFDFMLVVLKLLLQCVLILYWLVFSSSWWLILWVNWLVFIWFSVQVCLCCQLVYSCVCDWWLCFLLLFQLWVLVLWVLLKVKFSML